MCRRVEIAAQLHFKAIICFSQSMYQWYVGVVVGGGGGCITCTTNNKPFEIQLIIIIPFNIAVKRECNSYYTVCFCYVVHDRFICPCSFFSINIKWSVFVIRMKRPETQSHCVYSFPKCACARRVCVVVPFI